MKVKIKSKKVKTPKINYFSKVTYDIKRSAIFKYDFNWV